MVATVSIPNLRLQNREHISNLINSRLAVRCCQRHAVSFGEDLELQVLQSTKKAAPDSSFF